MTNSHKQVKDEQEKVCARTFLNWLSSQRGIEYEIERAEDCHELKGRWDFVSRTKGDTQWIALEVKELVNPQPRKQIGGWSNFCTLVTKELQTRKSVQGSFAIFESIPWTFNQSESKVLAKAFADAMPEITVNMELGSQINLGPEIATRFTKWPTEPPGLDMVLWHTQHVNKIIHRPKDIIVFKLEDSGCSLEIGISGSEASDQDSVLVQAILGIFANPTGKGSKPNEQLGEARQKGALETFLLLDSQPYWNPDLITKVLSNISQNLLSNINASYLISVHDKKVQKVWPNV